MQLNFEEELRKCVGDLIADKESIMLKDPEISFNDLKEKIETFFKDNKYEEYKDMEDELIQCVNLTYSKFKKLQSSQHEQSRDFVTMFDDFARTKDQFEKDTARAILQKRQNQFEKKYMEEISATNYGSVDAARINYDLIKDTYIEMLEKYELEPSEEFNKFMDDMINNPNIYNKKPESEIVDNASSDLNSNQSSENYSNVNNNDERVFAWVVAEQEVKAILKNPKTSKFPFSASSKDVDIQKSGNTYIVKSYVDAENSFGAVIRNNFTIKFERDGEKYTLIEAYIDEGN